jgi:hypothetical protein
MGRRQLILAAALLSSIGCKVDPKPPTEADGRQVWKNLNTSSGLDGDLQLADFKKTDGQMSEVNGVKVYTLFYELHEKHLTKLGQWKPVISRLSGRTMVFRGQKTGGRVLKGLIFPTERVF